MHGKRGDHLSAARQQLSYGNDAGKYAGIGKRLPAHTFGRKAIAFIPMSHHSSRYPEGFHSRSIGDII